MRWVAGVVMRARAVRSVSGRLGGVKDIVERAALAAALDREYPDGAWPEGGWSRVVRPDPKLGEAPPGGLSHRSEVRAAVAGRRALLVGNRADPRIAALFRAELGLECDVVAAVGSPRRREHLLERIRRGTYDIVLIAQSFASHGDTETIKEACERARAMNVLVGRGRLGQIVASLHRCISARR